jgi:hypothetical protein
MSVKEAAAPGQRVSTRYDWAHYDKTVKAQGGLVQCDICPVRHRPGSIAHAWHTAPDARAASIAAMEWAAELTAWAEEIAEDLAGAEAYERSMDAQYEESQHQVPAPVQAPVSGWLARFAGTCQTCKGAIEIGERIDRAQPFGYKHVDGCKAPAQAIEPAGAELVELPVMGRRHYAVENADGKLTFIRVTRVESGWTFIDQIIGGDREESRARITPSGEYRGTFRSIYDAVMADAEAAMLRYGQEIGRCGHCNRTLTDEASRAAGIGPVCAGKME